MKTIRRLFIVIALGGQMTLLGWRVWRRIKPLIPYWKAFQEIRPTLTETINELRTIRRNIAL